MIYGANGTYNLTPYTLKWEQTSGGGLSGTQTDFSDRTPLSDGTLHSGYCLTTYRVQRSDGSEGLVLFEPSASNKHGGFITSGLPGYIEIKLTRKGRDSGKDVVHRDLQIKSGSAAANPSTPATSLNDIAADTPKSINTQTAKPFCFSAVEGPGRHPASCVQIPRLPVHRMLTAMQK